MKRDSVRRWLSILVGMGFVLGATASGLWSGSAMAEEAPSTSTTVASPVLTQPTEINVTPNTNLTDGQTVTISGATQPGGAVALILIDVGYSFGYIDIGTTAANGSGQFSTTAPLPATFTSNYGDPIDCRLTSCLVGFRAGDVYGTTQGTNLVTFQSGATSTTTSTSTTSTSTTSTTEAPTTTTSTTEAPTTTSTTILEQPTTTSTTILEQPTTTTTVQPPGPAPECPVIKSFFTRKTANKLCRVRQEVRRDLRRLRPAAAQTYTVKPGDSLSKISAETLGNGNRYGELAQLNGIANPSLIHPGQVLVLPTT